MISKVRKRDGTLADFNPEKIVSAIWKSAQSVGGHDEKRAKELAQKVVKLLEEKYDGTTPSVEDVQDAVEKTLIEEGHATTAKAYILYRHRKSVEREMKKVLGVEDDLKLSVNSIQVLQRRYLLRNDKGEIIETPSGLLRRVARAIAMAEKKFEGTDKDVKHYEEAFYEIMSSFEFLPNSPTLMNAGTDIGQLSACFVLGVPDSLSGIFDGVKNAAMIHKSGGGTGFSFSKLRPKGDLVSSTAGVASGPVSFMTVFDHATHVIKQGGKRRGANMGVLAVSHPDIEDFITAKQTKGILENFNVSVSIDDKFMKAVEKDGEYELLNPRGGEAVRKVRAQSIFNLIAYSAWRSGEPGVLFMDAINRANPTPEAPIEATNPCGEVPMPNFESCNLGSIDLARFVELDWSDKSWKKKVNWDRLRFVTRLAVQFLDNVIELNKYPLPEIESATHRHRRIGLGVMGFAKMLFKMGVRYDSKEGFEAGEEIMKFITAEARKMSHELGRARGSFPEFKKSIWAKKYDAMRNATVTSIAPTGTLSMIAETSSGIEPQFALAYIKNVMDGTKLYYSEPVFEQVLQEKGLYTPELMKKIIERGSIKEMEEIPKEVRTVFEVSYDIPVESHIKMQAAFQKYTDLAVSKTVNMPGNATVDDVEKAYLLAWKSGCKGITVYRDKSREEQVLSTTGEEKVNKDAG